MLTLSKKSMRNDVPYWANAEDILQFCKEGRLNRPEKDFYMLELVDHLLSRIKALEEPMDELISDKEMTWTQ